MIVMLLWRTVGCINDLGDRRWTKIGADVISIWLLTFRGIWSCIEYLKFFPNQLFHFKNPSNTLFMEHENQIKEKKLEISVPNPKTN